MFLLLNTVIQLAAMFNPHLFTIVTYEYLDGEKEDVTVKGGVVAAISLQQAISFFFLSSMFISLSWLEVGEIVLAMSNKALQKRIRQFRKTAKIVSIAHIILSSILIASGYLNGFAYILSSLTAMTLILFFLGRRSFLNTVNILTLDTKKAMQNSLTLVNSLGKLHVFLLILITVTTILYPVLFPTFERDVQVGGFNYVLLIRDIGFYLGTFLAYTNVYYARTLFKHIRSNVKAEIKKNEELLTHSFRSVSPASSAKIMIVQVNPHQEMDL